MENKFDLIKDSKGVLYLMTDVNDLPKEFFTKYVKGKKFLDIGSGDGRIVLYSTMCGANAFGVELDDEMIKKCVLKRKIKKQNFLEIDFNNYDVIFYYIGSNISDEYDTKIISKLSNFSGTLIVYYKLVEKKMELFSSELNKLGFNKIEEINFCSVYKK